MTGIRRRGRSSCPARTPRRGTAGVSLSSSATWEHRGRGARPLSRPLVARRGRVRRGFSAAVVLADGVAEDEKGQQASAPPPPPRTDDRGPLAEAAANRDAVLVVQDRDRAAGGVVFGDLVARDPAAV